MDRLLIVNLLLFLYVTTYAIYMFVYFVKTRFEYIKLGKKVEFDERFKERLQEVKVNGRE